MVSEKLDEKAIFNVARQLDSPDARLDYLRHVCGADADLLERVQALLRGYEEQASFLESPPAGSASPTIDQPVIEKPGTLIGPYKLLQEIGQGGMGVVYMAEQQEPVRRKVALKIIKPGMDTRQVIARFEAERQALAMMDHVNIARVLDVGATEAGRPYFVMELVHGVPITNYCDNNRLTPRERLELFVPVCQAIQHAHQKGIIHRDIKPSNVMVTLYDGKPVPKVIDFGVAKATEQKLTERTLFTQYGTMVGTLEYMSPEQAEMSALGADTRSDIYSLGVLLYELLTGSTPLSSKRMKEAAYAEVLRMIKEEEPPKPSTRLSESGEALASISAQRHMDPAKLSKSMRGELDWIVMKTLEKDRNRRYESASGFAADVQRYLNDEPVQACPPSAAYRFRKFARRNKRVLTTMTLLAVMLLAAVGTVAGSLGWVSRGRAARRLVVEQAVVQALEEGDQLQKQGKWQEALVAVERAQAALAGGEGGAEVQQQVSDQLADLHMIQRLEQLRIERGMNLLRHERYSQAYARAFTDFGIDVENLSPPEVAARIRRRPSTAVRVAAALDDWAIVLRDWGLHDRTRDPATWKRLLEAARLADPDPWRSQLRQSMGQVDLNALRKLADSSEITTLPVQSLQLMGTALIFGGDGPACVAWLRNAHRLHPGDALITFDLAYHLSNLPSAEWVEVLRFAEAGLAVRQSSGRYSFVGYALSKLGRHDEAIAHYRKAIELQPDYVYAHANLGIVLSGQGKLDEAIACYRKAIELDSKFTSAHANLGNALARQGKVDEAIASHKKAIELDPKLAAAHDNLGNALSDKGKLDDAIASYKKAIELDPKDAKPRYNLGNALMAQRKLDEAIATYKKAIELDPKFASPHINLGKALAMQGKLDESIVCYRKAIELNPKLATAHGNLGTAFANQGDLDEAIECYRKAIELDSNFVNAHGNLGTALYLQKKLDEAIACYRKAIELDPKFAAAHSNLGKAFADRGELDEAIASLKRAIELDPKGAGAHDNLGNALARQGKLDEAIASLKRAIELDPKFASPHNNLGFVFHQQRKLDEAIACYRKAIELDPILAAAHSNLGNAFADQGDLDEAIACYRKAIELDSNFVNAQFNLGVALNEQGKLDEAIACYRKALELNPKLATAHRNLGIALSEQGKLDEAIACYHTAIELDPKVAAVHRNLGFALFHQKKLDEAIASYRSAIALDPEDSSVQLNLGIALSEQGKVDEAIACFRKAVELDPKYAKAHHVLGIALYRQGEVDEAIACYGKAVELDPKNAAAHNGLAWLLATSAEPKFRDPKRAVELAAKAGALDPKNSEYPSTLGAAHYRAGEWKAAITDLDKSMELREGGDANEWFFLAMAHWQLDEKEEARKWHDQAVAWMEKNKPEDDELKRFREEATELLGVKEK